MNDLLTPKGPIRSHPLADCGSGLIQPSFWYCTEPNTTLTHSRLMQSTGERVYHLQSVTFTRTATNETRVLGLQVSFTEQTSALWGEWPTKKQRPTGRHPSTTLHHKAGCPRQGVNLMGEVFTCNPGRLQTVGFPCVSGSSY